MIEKLGSKISRFIGFLRGNYTRNPKLLNFYSTIEKRSIRTAQCYQYARFDNRAGVCIPERQRAANGRAGSPSTILRGSTFELGVAWRRRSACSVRRLPSRDWLYASWLSTRIVPYIHIIYYTLLSFEKIAIPIRLFASSLFIPMPATRSRGCQRSRSLLTNEQIRLLFKVYGQCVYLLFSSAKENRVTVRPNDWSTECFLFFFFFFFLLFSSFGSDGGSHTWIVREIVNTLRRLFSFFLEL